MNEQVCCSHSKIELRFNEYPGGTRSDYWQCLTCDSRFYPADTDQSRIRLRNWYAGQALHVLAAKADKIKFPMSRLNDVDAWRKELAALVAKKCFIMADAMVEEGNK